MKRYLIILLSLLMAVELSAQRPRTRRGTTRKTTTTTKKTSAAATKNSKAATTKATQPQKSKSQLQKEMQEAARQKKEKQAQAARLNKSIKTSLDSVMILDNQIGKQQKSIDSLSSDIQELKKKISLLEDELEQLQKELADKKNKYAKAMVYLQKHKTVQEKLMFIFSAKNLEQMVRRMRYVREYSAFQRAQGQIIKEKQAEVRRKQNELLEAKTKLETHRVAMEEKRKQLEVVKGSCQKQVQFLNQNLATVQQQIKEYQRKESELNAQIERIIQAEIAEARRKAELERKRREEAARKKAAAEAKRLAEAKAARERAEAERKAAAERARLAKTDAEKKAAKAEMKRTESTLKAAAKEEKAAAKEYEKKTAEENASWIAEADADRKLSSNFASNKGRLPMPITGSYSVVGHYGTYNVAGLRNVQLDNKGIDIRGQAGAQARAVFDGVVSQVFMYGSQYIVMIRHGAYISVYSGLSSVAVSKGSKVSTRQPLGNVGTNEDGNYVLHFQLRQNSQRLNPESWVR